MTRGSGVRGGGEILLVKRAWVDDEGDDGECKEKTQKKEVARFMNVDGDDIATQRPHGGQRKGAGRPTKNRRSGGSRLGTGPKEVLLATQGEARANCVARNV